MALAPAATSCNGAARVRHGCNGARMPWSMGITLYVYAMPAHITNSIARGSGPWPSPLGVPPHMSKQGAGA
jgi:hypothetical protein